MYNFMTLKKKKKKTFFGQEAFYGRSDGHGQSNNFFFGLTDVVTILSPTSGTSGRLQSHVSVLP